jgi:diacylglycerol kinase family enzyme
LASGKTYYPCAALSGFLIVNPRSGSANPAAEELRQEAERRGIEVHLLRESEDAAELATRANAEALGVAGGDGSLAAVAETAIDRDRPFVCIPFGTRNHFARDLGLDRDDALGALDAFDGHERRVDVGRIGERLFLNNVTLGVYARLVHRREHRRRRQIALAGLRALLLSLRRRGPIGLTIDGSPVKARVALIANNHYTLDLFSIGARDRLDEGLLHLYLAEGWLPSSWDEQSAERFTIDATASQLVAAVDGEPAMLDTPLEFSVQPRALRVLLPPRHADSTS